MTTSPPPEIIAREQAYWHGFGRSVTEEARPLSGVDKLLMSDETISYGCQTCEYTNPNMKSVQTHQTKHSTKGYGVNKYEPELVEKILKWEQIERTAGVRGWAERVAKRLNKAKHTTLSGHQWLAEDVHSVARRYRLDSEPTPEHDPMAALDMWEKAQPVSMLPAEDTLALAAHEAQLLLTRIKSVQLGTCEHTDYEELKAKAAMLDQMRSFMGEGK